MLKTRIVLPTIVTAIVLGFASVPVTAQGDLIGAVDNIPPESPSNIAVVTDLGVNPTITVSWDLSPSDGLGFTSTDGGTGGVVPRNDVQSYIIKRQQFGETDAIEIARVAPGLTTYTDETVEQGLVYEYLVLATDGTGSSPPITSLPVSIGEPPSIYISETVPFDFGVVEQSASPSQPLLVSHAGPGSLSVGFFQLDAAGFVVSLSSDLSDPIDPTDRFDIAANGEQTFFVGFDATTAGNFEGSYEGTLFIITNDPNSQQLEVELKAVIEQGVPAPSVEVQAVLAFGAVSVGGSSPKALKISNTGGEPLSATLAVSGDPVFVLGATSVQIQPGDFADVEITFAADDNVFYNGILTITSDDPINPSVQVELKGLGKLQGEGVKPVTRKIVKARVTFPISLDFTDLAAVEQCAVDAATNIQASLASGFLVVNVTCTEGSTIVDFEVAADADAEEEPNITVEESLTELIADIEDPAVEVFPDLVDDLGAVDSVVDETEVVSLQPTDANGADIVGWFSRTGTRVDFDDFFVLADGFGRNVDSEELDVLDIAGPNQGPPDGVINFDDFFRFADDFGKTVANAAEIQSILGT